MPKRSDLKSILIIGAGPILIGQGCEFDYSGVQACKALKEEGYRIILVNSNPATIMAEPSLCDVTYIEPICIDSVSQVIERERPDAILPTMGGQTALNCTMELVKKGILAKYGTEIIGASIEAIEKAENREAFKSAMKHIQLEVPCSIIANDMNEALSAADLLGYPNVIRPSYTLGGSGGGIAYCKEQFMEICERGLRLSPVHSLLIEESLLGWKEFEMEVVRDKNDNCIIVCSIENIDPMGIHTGDSITVAPALTLTDKEYQRMRHAAIAILREIGVETGGANVQFAVHPKTGRMLVIEMNPRVSRSSALASKATGFPIARVAAKLAVGYTLDELRNEVTNGLIPASFEPTIDYIVTKIPRFDFEKFPDADKTLTTQMKSVGEVMAFGRTFQESLQKALCGLETGLNGLVSQIDESVNSEDAKNRILTNLETPNDKRLLYIADALRIGISALEIHHFTNIDPWFIAQIQELVEIETKLSDYKISELTSEQLFQLKRKGFLDKRIAQLLETTEHAIRDLRSKHGIRPVYKRVDSCSAEFPSGTAYLYATYEQICEAKPVPQKKIIILGSGPNRIGQGIEFDCCCVHAVIAFQSEGFQTIMINCNPETVSTDFDIVDRLYFEPLTLESVLEIVKVEKPLGVVVLFGGQTPLKLVHGLVENGVPILGTSPEAIDCAEDRFQFQQLVQKLGLKQTLNVSINNVEQGIEASNKIGFPMIVRPSYVLGGRAMRVIHTVDELKNYLSEAFHVSHHAPVLLERFLENAIEVDVDAVSDGEDVFIGGVLEHIEPAGIHSGDSSCSLPPFSLSVEIVMELHLQVIILAKALKVVGPLNVQFAIQNNIIYIIEVNPRISRTVPFVSQAIGISLAQVAARCMVNQSLKQQGILGSYIPAYYSIKKPVFPFDKFPGIDTSLGPEMKSTGEVMGIAETFEEAVAKATQSVDKKNGCKSLNVRCLQDLHKIVEHKIV